MNTPAASSFPTPPNFDVLLRKLQPVLDTIREAVQEGTVHVPEYFRGEAAPIDTALAPNLVRYKAKRFLIAPGQGEAKDEETFFEAEPISNNGICLRIPGFEIRVLKSTDEGSIPPPGISLTRRNLYNQLQARLDFSKPEWGIIVHWTVDDNYTLLKVSVALPLSFTKTEEGRQEVVCHFDEPYSVRSKRSKTTPIDQQQPPITDRDVPGVKFDDQQEKTGEDNEGE